MDVGAWLRELGLERYEAVFRANDIAWSLLPCLTSEDLRDIGVASLGHRKRLLAAIGAIGSGARIREAVAAGPERRHLTVMFVDLVGSTRLSVELDPEEVPALLAAYRSCVAEIVARTGGHVAKLVGDGVLAYFGWPIAQENEAERAAQAGIEIVAAVAVLEAPHGRRLAARVGIATGLVVVGELRGDGAAREEAVFGQTPNLASRLQDAAPPGGVVASAATRALIGDLFAIRELGPVHLKGFDEPVEAFEIVGARPIPTRFEGLHAGPLTPMAGREQELALIQERWSRARVGEG